MSCKRYILNWEGLNGNLYRWYIYKTVSPYVAGLSPHTQWFVLDLELQILAVTFLLSNSIVNLIDWTVHSIWSLVFRHSIIPYNGWGIKYIIVAALMWRWAFFAHLIQSFKFYSTGCLLELELIINWSVSIIKVIGFLHFEYCSFVSPYMLKWL